MCWSDFGIVVTKHLHAFDELTHIGFSIGGWRHFDDYHDRDNHKHANDYICFHSRILLSDHVGIGVLLRTSPNILLPSAHRIQPVLVEV